MNQYFNDEYHDNKEQVQRCIEWLSLQTITKGINKYHTSYGYKHMVENWCCRYISNDSFKEAVYKLGIKYKNNDNKGLNICVAINETKLQRMLKNNYGRGKEI